MAESNKRQRPRLQRSERVVSEQMSAWELFVRESLVQIAWPMSLSADMDIMPPEVKASSSATELISRRGVFSRRHYGSVEQLPQTEVEGVDQHGRRFRIENGDSIGEKDEMFGSPSAPVLENPEYQTRWYFKYFLGKLHQNYVGCDVEKNPFFLSVVLTEVNSQCVPLYRAILFKKSGTQKISLPYVANQKVTVKQILSNFPNMERVEKSPKEIYSPDIQKDLLLLEEQEGSVNFKFGIVYMKEGQSTDDEMLSNEIGSEHFDEFVNLLGEKVRLKGWDKYRGGLDVKGDMTGRYSIYTIYEGHEVMFHVSTLLPFSKDNRQQVERKRHIGNDIVNIVFIDRRDNLEQQEKEQGEEIGDFLNTFNPTWIKSQFTHVFAVVTIEKDDSYRLSIFCDETVPLFGPSLPCPPLFSNPQLFREFLLVKLINGEKATFQTPTFAKKRERTLDMLIKDLYSEYMNDTRMTMLNRRAFSEVLTDAPRTSRLKEDARQIEFVRIGQALKLDAIMKGDAPTSLASAGGSSSTIFKRAPWEPNCFYPVFPNTTITCGDSWGEHALVMATEEGVYVVEDHSTHRMVIDKTLQVRQINVVEAHGILLLRAGNSNKECKVYVFRLSEFTGNLSGDPPGPRSRCEVKDRRLEKTRGCHLYAISRPGGAYLRMAVAVGKRVMLFQWRHTAAWTAWCAANDTDTVEGFIYVKEITLTDTPSLMTLLDGQNITTNVPVSDQTGSSPSVSTHTDAICVGFKNHFEIVHERSGQGTRLHTVEGVIPKANLVAALDLYEDQEVELLLCYNHTCHFQKISEDGASSTEYDFHWNTVPTSIVCAFPYIIAFTSDSMEIRLIVNGNLVHTISMPKLQLITSKNDIFFATTAPEFYPIKTEKVQIDCSRENQSILNRDVKDIIHHGTPHSPPNSPHANVDNSKPLRLYRIPLAHLSGTSAISEHGRRPPSASSRRYTKMTGHDRCIAEESVDKSNTANNTLSVPSRELSRSCSSSPTPTSNKNFFGQM